MVLIVIEAKEVPMNIGIAHAKARLSELVNRVAFGDEYVILESRGKPKAALVSLDDLEHIQGMRRTLSTRTHRLLALAEADRVRRSLESRNLVPVSEEVPRLREGRIDALS
jgi:prevent-host-death family protein